MNFLTAHLRAVNENYFQHFCHAMSFSGAMFVGSIACCIHAVFPFLCEKTGSDYIRGLHQRMVINRHTLTPADRKPVNVKAQAAA